MDPRQSRRSGDAAVAEFAERIVDVLATEDGSLAVSIDVYRVPRFRRAEEAVALVRAATGPLVNVYVRFVTTSGREWPLPTVDGRRVGGYLRGDDEWSRRWRAKRKRG